LKGIEFRLLKARIELTASSEGKSVNLVRRPAILPAAATGVCFTMERSAARHSTKLSTRASAIDTMLTVSQSFLFFYGRSCSQPRSS